MATKTYGSPSSRTAATFQGHSRVRNSSADFLREDVPGLPRKALEPVESPVNGVARLIDGVTVESIRQQRKIRSVPEVFQMGVE